MQTWNEIVAEVVYGSFSILEEDTEHIVGFSYKNGFRWRIPRNDIFNSKLTVNLCVYAESATTLPDTKEVILSIYAECYENQEEKKGVRPLKYYFLKLIPIHNFNEQQNLLMAELGDALLQGWKDLPRLIGEYAEATKKGKKIFKAVVESMRDCGHGNIQS